MTLAETLPPLTSSVSAATTFYVDGAKGADTNAGSIDKPWKTLPAAQTAVRAMDKSTGITVFIRAGVYPLAETLTFSAADGMLDLGLISTTKLTQIPALTSPCTSAWCPLRLSDANRCLQSDVAPGLPLQVEPGRRRW